MVCKRTEISVVTVTVEMGKRERERKEEGEEEDAASCTNLWLRRTGCHQVPQLFSFCCVGFPLKAKISGCYLNEHLCFPFWSLFICIKGECPAAYTECRRLTVSECQSNRAAGCTYSRPRRGSMFNSASSLDSLWMASVCRSGSRRHNLSQTPVSDLVKD